MMIVSVWITFIQMKQAGSLVKTCNKQMLLNQKDSRHRTLKSNKISYLLSRFFQFHTRYLISICVLNEQFGAILVKLVLINTPVNAFTIISTLTRKGELILIYFLLVAIFAQSFFIFGIHFMAIHFSAQIHHCSKGLIRFNISNLKLAADKATTRRYVRFRLTDVKMQLKLDNYICKFHTTKRYGITYGGCGLVTFQTFSKVCNSILDYFHFINSQTFKFLFFYGKFLMFFYRLHRKS